jgi:hypothetical protein
MIYFPIFRKYEEPQAIVKENNTQKFRGQVANTGVSQNEKFAVNVDTSTQDAFHIHPNMAYHGYAGPVSVTYPNFIYEQSGMKPLHYRSTTHKPQPLLAQANSDSPSAQMINKLTRRSQLAIRHGGDGTVHYLRTERRDLHWSYD